MHYKNYFYDVTCMMSEWLFKKKCIIILSICIQETRLEKYIQKNAFGKWIQNMHAVNALRKKCIQKSGFRKMNSENTLGKMQSEKNAFRKCIQKTEFIFWMHFLIIFSECNQMKLNAIRKCIPYLFRISSHFFFRRNKITRKKNSTMWKCFFAFFRAWSRIFSSSFSEFISLNSFFWIYFLNLFSENIFWMFLKFFWSDILSFTR